MSKRLAAILVTLIVGGLFPALHAEASTAPACGTTGAPFPVHGTVSFTADLDCSGAAQTGLKLVGPATIKLNGHTFSGSVAGGPAVDNSSGFRLKLLGPGMISGWAYGVESEGRTQVHGLTFEDMSPPVAAIVINASKAQVDRNRFVDIVSADNLVTITGAKAKVRGNDMTDPTNDIDTADIEVHGNKALVSGNHLVAPVLGADTIFVEGNHEKLIKNTSTFSGGNGIHVDGINVQIKKNVIKTDLNDGVFIESASRKVIVTKNTISDNGAFGVESQSGTNPGHVKHNQFATNLTANCNFTPCS